MGDSRERLWGINATLVQDAVNAKGCGGKTEDIEVERQSVSFSRLEDLMYPNEAAAGPRPHTETNATATPSDHVSQQHP